MTSATTERLATSAEDDRPHQQVEGGDEQDRDEAAAELVDLQLAGQQPGRDVERDDAGDERRRSPA